jgi:drug/metabolite transporter (DMT)-like permease
VRTERRQVETLGGAFIGLASLQFGAVVVLGKIVQRHLAVPSMLGIRFGVAAFLLVAALSVRGEPLLPARGERTPLATLGVLGYAVEATLFFLALKHGEAAAVTLLFFTYPVFVALASWAMGRGAPGWLLGASLVCASSGAALVVLASGGLAISGLGVLFALASSLSFTAYLILADLVLKRTPPLAGSMWVSAWAALGLGIYAVATGQGQIPDDGGQWLRLVAMGVATAGAFVCLFAGLLRLGPVRTAIVAATEPLAAAVLAAIFLSEPIRWSIAVGGVLILAGAVAASLARAQSPGEPPVP